MFDTFPRYVGFPNQLYVAKKQSFENFKTMFMGKVPFFVSHYRFKDKDTPIVDRLFFDIDSYYSIRFPYKNTKLLKDWAYHHDIPYRISYSGGKGYHTFLIFKDRIPKDEKEYEYLKDMCYSIQVGITEEIGLEAYDEPTFGRLRFLVRYPTSKYIRKDEDTGAFESNGMYCRNLTDKEFDLGVKRLVDVVKTPGIVPTKPKATKTIEEVADCLKDFKVKKRRSYKSFNFDLKRGGESTPTINSLGLPCIKEIAKLPHPTHYERIELVAWLKSLGYTDLAINIFIKERNWTRYNYATTSYQIRTVKSRFPKCTYLRKSYNKLCKKCIFGGGKK